MKVTTSKHPSYPQPPFKKQDQPVPGVSKKMDPLPDHGEKSYIGNNLLTGQVCLITGGDSGIGKAVAIAMAREGADIAIIYLDEIESEDAADTANWIEKAGRKALLIQGDIREESFCESAIKHTIKEFGRLDILINNAAYQMSYKSITDISYRRPCHHLIWCIYMHKKRLAFL